MKSVSEHSSPFWFSWQEEIMSIAGVARLDANPS